MARLVAAVSAGASRALSRTARPPGAGYPGQLVHSPRLRRDAQGRQRTGHYKDMGALAAKIPQDADKIDPKLQAQFEATAKKYGFTSYAEYDDVFNNVSLVMSGIDPQTKSFTEPPEALKRQIAEVQSDKKMSKEEKNQALEDMNEALKDAKPVEFKENVALVTKYLDKLGAIMEQQP
jgi:hypothetical protein